MTWTGYCANGAEWTYWHKRFGWMKEQYGPGCRFKNRLKMAEFLGLDEKARVKLYKALQETSHPSPNPTLSLSGWASSGLASYDKHMDANVYTGFEDYGTTGLMNNPMSPRPLLPAMVRNPLYQVEG